MIVQLTDFMGYANPARSSPAGIKMGTIGFGFGAYKGLTQGGSPFKMISYGLVDLSNLTKPRHVNVGKPPRPIPVKSINIFPLPVEWERTVGFIGTCANMNQLHFTPFRGALSYSTRMATISGASIGTIGSTC